MSFQENLRHYREKAGYKQAKDFARILNISYTTYIAYENQGREPKFNVLCKIADLLNVSTDELLGRENNILGMNEDERLKKEINIILSISDIKYLKLQSINAEYVSFDLCGNDENLIQNTFFRKKDFLNMVNMIKNSFSDREKKTIYEWTIQKGIEQEVIKLNQSIDDLKKSKLKKLKEYERLQMITSDLYTLNELQKLKDIIQKKFLNSYEFTQLDK